MEFQGQRVRDHYLVGEVLGEGAGAMVCRAEDLHLGRAVAIKLLNPEGRDSTFVTRFERMVHVATQLDHPNIVPVYDYGEGAGTFFLVMQYLPAGDLGAQMEAGARIPLDDSLRIGAEVAEALGEAHWQGIVHRDVKPANVLLTADGHAKVTDFGVAELLQVPTPGGTVRGSADHLAPEQANDGDITPATDVYSLGVVLYRLLGGRLPFAGDSTPRLTKVNSAVPARVGAVVEQALAKDPASRYADGRAMSAALWEARRFLAMSHAGAGRGRPWIPAPTRAGTQPSTLSLLSATPPSRQRVPPPAVMLKTSQVQESAPEIPDRTVVPRNRSRVVAARHATRPIILIVALASAFAALFFVGLLFGARQYGEPSPPRERDGEVAGAAAPGSPAGDSPPADLDARLDAPETASSLEEAEGQPLPPAAPGPSRAATLSEPISADAVTVVLDDDAFSGGFSAPRNYRGRTARWMYGAGSAYGNMTAEFSVPGSPRAGNLTIVGIDSENGPKTPMEVLVNDTVVFSGGNPLPKDSWAGPVAPWSEATFPIPAGVLQADRNTVTIRNRAQVDNFNSPPYIAIDQVVIATNQ
jgi:serine/threonine protein kinase